MREQFKHWTPITVRWGDMDRLGHVNNAVYFSYFETGRILYFLAVGLDDPWRHGHGPVLANAHCDFKAQIVFPAELELGTRVGRLGRSSFTLEYALFAKDQPQPVAEGSTVAVWADFKAGNSAPLPDSVRQAIIGFEGLDPNGTQP